MDFLALRADLAISFGFALSFVTVVPALVSTRISGTWIGIEVILTGTNCWQYDLDAFFDHTIPFGVIKVPVSLEMSSLEEAPDDSIACLW